MLVLAACGGGGGGSGPADGTPTPPPAVVNASPGGIWTGVRPNDTPIIVLISEAGEMRILDEFGNQGFGTVQVTNQTDVASSYQIAPPFGDSIIDGSSGATCNLSGSIQERLSIDYTIECTTSLGGTFGGAILLTYVPEYGQDSSIARIAGQYDVGGDVLTIDAAGALFLQGSQTGCVVSGEVLVMDAARNLYDVRLTTENCQPPNDPLNGASWDGLGTILPNGGGEILLTGLTAVVDGLPVSLILVLPRI